MNSVDTQCNGCGANFSWIFTLLKLFQQLKVKVFFMTLKPKVPISDTAISFAHKFEWHKPYFKQNIYYFYKIKIFNT